VERELNRTTATARSPGAAPAVPYPDGHYLSAAVGWMQLGELSEAKQEVGRISPEWRGHPDVMQVRWLIHAELREWEDCVTIAEETIAVAPDHASGWINHANALFFLRRTREAYAELGPIAERFPTNEAIAYNLACYACQLGLLPESQNWLGRALAIAAKVGERGRIKKMALEDPDLKPLWREIRRL